MSAALRLSAVTHRFGSLTVVDNVTFEVPPGSITVLVGPTGCGKSTILRIAAGLIQPNAGQVTIGGRPAAAGMAGFMTQGDTLLPWRRALANAVLGGVLAGRDEASVEGEARDLFARFGLGGFEHAWPSELSGGMGQRVGLLRTVLARQPVILLDEPFGSLDAATRLDLHGWLATLVAEAHATVLMVSHDLDEALRVADRIVVLSHRPGRVLEEISLSEPRPRSLQHLAAPDFAMVKYRLLDALSTS